MIGIERRLRVKVTSEIGKTIKATKPHVAVLCTSSSLKSVVAQFEEVLKHRVPIVTTTEEAEELAFPGSPTIRVDGRDVDPAGAGSRPALTCRIYHLPDGRVSPVPSREQLEEAIS